MRGKEGSRYYLDIGTFKGCIKNFNDNPSLCMSELSKQLGSEEICQCNHRQKSRGKVIEVPRKKDGRMS